jgi:hypothetical protein
MPNRHASKRSTPWGLPPGCAATPGGQTPRCSSGALAWRGSMRLGGALILGVGILAGEAKAIVVNPARSQLTLAPGQEERLILRVTNDREEPVDVEVGTKDWFVLEANKSVGVDQWLKLQGETRFTLQGQERRQIPVVVVCPEKAQGEMVGMVSFLYRGKEPSMVTPIISVSVYLAVKGTEKVDGQIKDVAVGRWKGNLHVGALVRSTGNVHLRPTGQITIYDEKNAVVIRLPVPEGGPTYPGREQPYICPESDIKLAAGRYFARAELSYKDLIMRGEKEFSVSNDGEIRMKGQEAPKP